MSVSTGYNGNPNLKAAGTQQNWTAEQIDEWIKCRDDPIYFIEKYIKIITLDHGLQPIKLYKYQKEIILSLSDHRKSAAVLPRQSGKSTTIAAFFCYYVVFNDDKTCAILANKAATAREILSRVQLAYEYIPNWMQHGVVEWNKGSFKLENHSRILAASTSSSSVRGASINFLLLDEYAFIQQNLAEEFFASVYPTISAGKTSKIAIVSTPKGMNHFYKLVVEAEAKTNGFNLIKATWRDVDGRDDKWAAEERKVLGDLKFDQEHDCKFIGSSGTLISSLKLSQIPVALPIAYNHTTKVYSKPEPRHKYVISADCSEGVGADYSAFIIFDITELPYKIVMTFRDNSLSSFLYPGVIYKAAREYNNASVLIERNSIGEGVANSFYYDFEYEETIMSSDGGVISSFGGKLPGMKTTKKTKAIGCDICKQIVEDDKVIVNDADLIYEMSNFVQIKNSFAAETGNDDLMMCLINFSYLTGQVAFGELSNDSIKARIIQERQRLYEEQALPVGFLNTGTETELETFNF